MTLCNCPPNNCTCGCSSGESCYVCSPSSSCQVGDPCSHTQGNCPTDPCAQACCAPSNLFVTTMAAFNMPACDMTGSIFVDDASRVAPGSVLYAEGVGYLVVQSVNDACELIVLNECPNCDNHVLDPGQPVAVGTQFIVTAPVCVDVADETYLGPRLASDYFIPAVGNCVTVAVTSIEGLAIGDIVSINNNRYVIDDIPTTEAIIICNQGDGGSPGQLVEADPGSDGIWDYPVLRITSANPCLDDPVDAGKLIVCDGTEQKRLEGSIDNQVPAWDESQDEFVLKVIDDLSVCVTLASCLTLDPEDEDCEDYLVDVSPNTTALAEELAKVSPNYLKVTINGDAFCINDIVDSNTIRVIPGFPVTQMEQYDPGAVLCVVPCCYQCDPAILTMGRSDQPCGAASADFLVGTGVDQFINIPTGYSTYTYPPALGEEYYCGDEALAENWWVFEFVNDDEECCGCDKYIEIASNFEAALNIPADVYANIEFRILKLDPFESLAGAANHFTGGRGLFTAWNECDLVYPFQTINTWKGFLCDRDFVGPGERGRYAGHVRLVFENNSGAPVTPQFVINWRIWMKAWDYACATIENREYYEPAPV